MRPLEIINAREHNLKNITLTIPTPSLTVFTGVSGSGKSSLAFDTIYAESQRRYVESFSAYARQFLVKLERPAVDAVRGLSPAVAIEQKTVNRSPRSTVGTVTEVYDYLRLLYATVGTPHCPACGTPIRRQTPEAVAAWAAAQPEGTRLTVLAPLARGRKGAFKKELAAALKRGFPRARIDGALRALDEEDVELDKRKAHDIAVVIDRLVIKAGVHDRLQAAVRTATELADGLALLAVENGPETLFSLRLACPDCGVSLPDPEPRSFSFNSRFGACERCGGLGVVVDINPEAVIEDPSRPLGETTFRVRDRRAVEALRAALQAAARHHQVSMETTLQEAPADMRRTFFYGTNEKLTFRHGDYAYRARWVGVADYLKARFQEGRGVRRREEAERLTAVVVCPACNGVRLRPEARAVTVAGRPIGALTQLPVAEVEAWARALRLSGREAEVAAGALHEIRTRLRFLVDIGLGYLTLDRPAGSLSGGESRRVRLATQLGAPLRGVLYVLDEPSIGLHPRDNERLLASLERLRDAGNTVIVVEHDEATIRRADWVVDLGPGAGTHGGRLIAAGPPEVVMAAPDSVTARYLTGAAAVVQHRARRVPDRGYVTVVGATHHNLRDVTVRFPVGLLTVVTGVSGAGKSSLVIDVLHRALRPAAHPEPPGAHRRIEGAEAFDKVIEIDQSPIGRTPRSNPATYTGVFTPIRELYAGLPEAKARGYRAGRFSFNVKGGRCEACEGDGLKRIEMAFLPDVYVPCEVCRGRRYNRETLQVKYRGRDIAETLDLTIEEALEAFAAWPAITNKLRTLVAVGLGYLTLGQSATTLSGGEAQRLKLACELARRATGRTLYILDEPTTGLHFEDVRRLLDVLHALVEQGNTVIVIEHHTDVMWAADWIIDLGPEGGTGGGRVVGEGPPETVARLATPTGRALAAARKGGATRRRVGRETNGDRTPPLRS